MLNQTLIQLYAKNVITFGNRTLSQVHHTYLEAVKLYIAQNFTVAQIQNAKNKGWITEVEEAELLLMRQEQLTAGTNEIGEPKQVI